MNKEECLIMGKIAERADKLGKLAFDKLSLIMDLEHVHGQIGLRLNDLLNADDFNFLHDIVGIQNNINRTTGKLNNHFLPRYSRG